MSYDLYLWHGPQPVTAQRAMAICHELARSQNDSVIPDAAVPAFHDDLIARFPRWRLSATTRSTIPPGT
ncbi:hypothetical protein ACFQ9X_12765 [Catenulispora yoronensis]